MADTVRDALATALRDYSLGHWSWRCDTPSREPGDPICDFTPEAAAILADPAFRAALTDAVAEALARTIVDHPWGRHEAPHQYDSESAEECRAPTCLAAALVARMLGEEPSDD